MPVGLRLFLPEDWTADPARCALAGVPEAATAPQSKGQIALTELDRLRAESVRFGIVLTDAGYGCSAAFRHGHDARGLAWAVGIAKDQKVYDPDVRLVPPGVRARKPVPDQEPREAEAVLAKLPWRRVTWRQGTKSALSARFAMTRMRVGDGPVWANNRHLPGGEVWLVGEWRASGERKYYLSNLPLRTTRRVPAGTIKARWICEQAHQQMKEELGLDHFEGRSWTGLHRHALMRCNACAYQQHLRLVAPDRTDRGKRWPAYRGRRRLRACQPCVRPSSGGCSWRLSRPCNVRTVGIASGCCLTSKCPGSDRDLLIGHDHPGRRAAHSMA
ncbi:hypothetical protein MSPGM_36990 [Methylorubrum sp. GM97]|nr:hypothetical protein MSPGM_36990 [Methylorubrum sp. GM97]